MGYLPHTRLSTDARKVYIFPLLTNASLFSLGQLFDNDCTITLDKQKLTISKNNNIIIQGVRNNNDGLWDINLPSITPIKIPKFIPQINHVQNTTTITHTANIIVQRQSLQKLITYYYRCDLSPSKSTWIQAVKDGNFYTWPGLTTYMVQTYYPITAATAKGHVDQEQKNLRSTKPNVIPPTQQEKKDFFEDHFPPQDTTIRKHQTMCKVVPFC